MRGETVQLHGLTVNNCGSQQARKPLDDYSPTVRRSGRRAASNASRTTVRVRSLQSLYYISYRILVAAIPYERCWKRRRKQCRPVCGFFWQ